MMEKRNNKKRLRAILLVIVVFAFFVMTIYQNLVIKNIYYTLEYDNLPNDFSNYRIAQISDLHNATFGKNNAQLINSLGKNQPNIIVITGDLIDSNHIDIEVAIEFVKQAKKIAPCYFVTGNHEAWIGKKYNELEKELLEQDVIVLRNENVSLQHGKSTLELIGVDDPQFMERTSMLDQALMQRKLQEISVAEDSFKILLSHRPELFDVYVDHSMDLVLSGHAHGGQFRIPF
ncbi:metallophosphoesterase, partial [Globicatella sulfidifaciens]